MKGADSIKNLSVESSHQSYLTVGGEVVNGVGYWVGVGVGSFIGVLVGGLVGASVGALVGTLVGTLVGALDGDRIGDKDGFGEKVGPGVTGILGAAVDGQSLQVTGQLSLALIKLQRQPGLLLTQLQPFITGSPDTWFIISNCPTLSTQPCALAVPLCTCTDGIARRVIINFFILK